MDEDGKISFDASFMLTFEAFSLEDAEEKFESLLEWLYEQGYEANGVATIEETIQIG